MNGPVFLFLGLCNGFMGFKWIPMWNIALDFVQFWFSSDFLEWMSSENRGCTVNNVDKVDLLASGTSRLLMCNEGGGCIVERLIGLVEALSPIDISFHFSNWVYLETIKRDDRRGWKSAHQVSVCMGKKNNQKTHILTLRAHLSFMWGFLYIPQTCPSHMKHKISLIISIVGIFTTFDILESSSWTIWLFCLQVSWIQTRSWMHIWTFASQLERPHTSAGRLFGHTCV